MRPVPSKLRPQRRSTGMPAAVLAAVLGLVAPAVTAQVRLPAVPAAHAGPLHGEAPLPGIGGALDGVDQHGRAFSLARLAGRPGLVFFGFTHCGSTCPVALGTARQLLQAHGARPAPPLVFVTLDPLSDGPAELKDFLGRVDPRLLGLTGTPAQIAAAVERYGVGTRAREGGVDHSSLWYLLDGQGRVRRVYAHTTPASHLLEDLQRLAAL
jgi:protein SCO1